MEKGEQVIHLDINTKEMESAVGQITDWKEAVGDLQKELLVLRLAFGRLKAGECVTIALPMELRVIPASDSRYYNLAWGPYLLAALSDSNEFMHPELSELTEQKDAGCGVFTAGETRFVPLHRVDKEKYHIYYRR